METKGKEEEEANEQKAAAQDPQTKFPGPGQESRKAVTGKS